MTDKARHRLAARVHKQFVRDGERLRRAALRKIQSIYPVRVGWRYVNREGGRFVVTQIDWGYKSDLSPWPDGPLVVLKFDTEEFNLRIVRYWDELAREFRRVR
jgi:hypothetical protein